MLHKIKNFDDPDLDRQLREIIDAINNPCLIHQSNGKPYFMLVDDDSGQTPNIILQEVQ